MLDGMGTDTNQVPIFFMAWHVTKIIFAQHTGVKWGYSQPEELARGWSHLAIRTSLPQLPSPAQRLRSSA